MKPILDLISLGRFAPEIHLDIRYARSNNFLNKPVYPFEQAYLQKRVAEDLKRAHLELEKKGYGILVFDGYRPWSVTRLFWNEATPQMRNFLASPERGSVHNRGCAVDCSLFLLSTGQEVRMPSAFDEMNEKAYPVYQSESVEEMMLRDLLIQVMSHHHFSVLKNEWWHFNHELKDQYPLMDVSFEELEKALNEK